MHTHKGTSIRHRLQALGVSVVFAGSVLGTTAATTLGMSVRPLAASGDLQHQIYRSLASVTWAAAKVAAGAEMTLGLHDPASADTFRVPHQAAPVR